MSNNALLKALFWKRRKEFPDTLTVAWDTQRASRLVSWLKANTVCLSSASIKKQTDLLAIPNKSADIIFEAIFFIVVICHLTYAKLRISPIWQVSKQLKHADEWQNYFISSLKRLRLGTTLHRLFKHQLAFNIYSS